MNHRVLSRSSQSESTSGGSRTISHASMITPAEEVGRLLKEQGLMLALAESCTGGLVGNLITDVPGSSDYFLGSAVTYAYGAKEAVLGVQHETLETCGAVSPEVAAEMAQGARRLFDANLALAVTGIAGPTGGLPGKPVGLVYLHLSAPDAEISEHHVWGSDRAGNKRLSADAALELLFRYLAGRQGQGPGLTRACPEPAEGACPELPEG